MFECKQRYSENSIMKNEWKNEIGKKFSKRYAGCSLVALIHSFIHSVRAREGKGGRSGEKRGRFDSKANTPTRAVVCWLIWICECFANHVRTVTFVLRRCLTRRVVEGVRPLRRSLEAYTQLPKRVVEWPKRHRTTRALTALAGRRRRAEADKGVDANHGPECGKDTHSTVLNVSPVVPTCASAFGVCSQHLTKWWAPANTSVVVLLVSYLQHVWRTRSFYRDRLHTL